MKEEILILTNEETKLCTRCGKFLNILRFSNKRSSGDGLQSWCKECHREYKIARRLESAKNTAGYMDVKLSEVPRMAREMDRKQKTDLRNYLMYLADKIR